LLLYYIYMDFDKLPKELLNKIFLFLEHPCAQIIKESFKKLGVAEFFDLGENKLINIIINLMKNI